MMPLFCFVYSVLAHKSGCHFLPSRGGPACGRGPRPNLWISKWHYVRGALIQTGRAKHANAGYWARRCLKCRRRRTEPNRDERQANIERGGRTSKRPLKREHFTIFQFKSGRSCCIDRLIEFTKLLINMMANQPHDNGND